MTRAREVEKRPFPSNRRLVTAALRAGRHTVPVHGLLDLDVSTAMNSLAAHEPPLSVTAFIAAAVGRAVALHPEVHAYRNWRGLLVIHRHVDISTIVEITTPQGAFPLVHTLRDADIREVKDISEELHRIKNTPLQERHRAAGRLLPVFVRIPGAIRAMYALLSRSSRLRQRSGTVTLTAIGMFADGGGFAIAPLTLMSLQVVVGGITDRPWAGDDRIDIRKVLDLTVTVDHNVVDGGPATRFGAELRHQIETATVLQTPS